MSLQAICILVTITQIFMLIKGGYPIKWENMLIFIILAAGIEYYFRNQKT